MAQPSIAVGDAIISASLDGTIVGWNAAAEQLFGRPAADAVGRNLSLLIPRERLRVHCNAIALVREGIPIGPIRMQCVRDTGERFDAVVHLSPVVDRRGDVAGIAACARDPESSGAAAAIPQSVWQRANERMTRDSILLANVRDAIIVTDVDGIVTEWNDGAARLFGWTAAETIGRPLVNCCPPHARAAVEALTRAVLRGGDFSGRVEDYRKDGSPVWVDARVSVMRDGGGRPIGVMRIAHDIMPRRQAERERDAALAEMQMHVDRLPLAYIKFDRDMAVVDWNPAAERMFGFTRGEMVGAQSGLDRLMGPEALAGVRAVVGRLRAGDAAAHSIHEHLTKDGRRITCEWVNTPLLDRTGAFHGVVGLVQDITRRRELEAQLQQAMKMDAIGQLAGGVAHDFNNLLTVINGYGELLLDQMPPDDPNRDTVLEIVKAGARSSALTRQLLAFSRKQVIAPRPVDLNVTVRDMQKMLRRIIGEDVELVTKLAAELPEVFIDPGQLEQALLNLAVNARDAMPHGGTLTIETDAAPAGVVLEVRDTGIGMSAATKARIFEPFFTTKPAGKGTGLGLAAVHGIVSQSHGTIEVETELEAGTAFRICFPPVAERREAGDGGACAAAARDRSGTILLVEDEISVRALTTRILQRAGYTVLAAAGAGEAMRVAQEHGASIDLLIADVVMPRLGGREVATHLAAMRPEMKVLYVSGYTEETVVRHGVESARGNFLQKPFTLAALTSKVTDLLSN